MDDTRRDEIAERLAHAPEDLADLRAALDAKDEQLDAANVEVGRLEDEISVHIKNGERSRTAHMVWHQAAQVTIQDGSARIAALEDQLRSAEAVVEAAREIMERAERTIERNYELKMVPSHRIISAFRLLLAAHDASRPQPEGAE
jgi:chromosome segregation ATPase